VDDLHPTGSISGNPGSAKDSSESAYRHQFLPQDFAPKVNPLKD